MYNKHENNYCIANTMKILRKFPNFYIVYNILAPNCTNTQPFITSLLPNRFFLRVNVSRTISRRTFFYIHIVLFAHEEDR